MPLETVLQGSRYLGTFQLPDLLSFASSRCVNGIAVFKESGSEVYTAFLDEEPEGAVSTDEKGVLFRDKAVLVANGTEKFVLTEIGLDVVETLIMSCRIFDKNRLKKNMQTAITDIGGGGSGIGVLTVTVKKEGQVANGIRVSLRKDGKIVGSDITTSDGSVGFRVAFGKYECLLQDRSQVVPGTGSILTGRTVRQRLRYDWSADPGLQFRARDKILIPG